MLSKNLLHLDCPLIIFIYVKELLTSFNKILRPITNSNNVLLHHARLTLTRYYASPYLPTWMWPKNTIPMQIKNLPTSLNVTIYNFKLSSRICIINIQTFFLQILHIPTRLIKIIFVHLIFRISPFVEKREGWN